MILGNNSLLGGVLGHIYGIVQGGCSIFGEMMGHSCWLVSICIPHNFGDTDFYNVPMHVRDCIPVGNLIKKPYLAQRLVPLPFS